MDETMFTKPELDVGNESAASTNQEESTCLIPGFRIDDGMILCDTNLRKISDAPIIVLNLSTRPFNALQRSMREKINRFHSALMVSDILSLNRAALEDMKNMGTKSVDEIIEKLKEYLTTESDKDHSVLENRTECKTQEFSNDKNLCADIVRKNAISAKVVLPELDKEQPVLAPDYAVADGVICNRVSFEIIPDAPIEALQLSVRSSNCLARQGIQTISGLIGYPCQEFRQIRNLGARSASEIQEKLEQYLERQRGNARERIIPLKTVSKSGILHEFHQHEFETVTVQDLCERFPDAQEADVQKVLKDLALSGNLTEEDEGYRLFHPTFAAFIDGLSDEENCIGLDRRSVIVLQGRASGKTLEELGESEGVTRERIRQVEKKAFHKLIRNDRVCFAEDRYAYFFRTYSFDKEFFCQYLKGTEQGWYYLNFRYSNGKQDLQNALEDRQLSVEERRAADKYLHRNYLLVEEKYIPVQRGSVEDYIAEKYCRDDVTVEEFFEFYSRFLAEYGLTDEKLQLSESIYRTRENRLADSRKLLWKQNRRIRYYDIDGGDFSELLETLNLGSYSDVEISTRKFIVDFPELMERYDIRDEYELHNLLKKIHAEKENPAMRFGRMPHIQFGTFDRDAAVKEVLFAMAPVSMDDLAEMISLEYGFRIDTIKANWLNCISEYYHQGIYDVSYIEMPQEHMTALKEALTEDFYFMHEVRKLYRQLVDNADLSLLSTYNLKKMGFLIGGSYIVQNYPTAEAYFVHLFTEKDVVDIEPYSRKYTGLSTYSSCLERLRGDLEIIEFEPFHYINVRKLEKLGYDKAELKKYGDRVWSSLTDDVYFTIQSLREDGFEDALEALGFGDMFYSSLLKQDARFSWQRVGNTVVFNPKGERFTVRDFLVEKIKCAGAVDADEFVSELCNRYGVSFERFNIVEKVKGSDIYYDTIMEKFYADYETYFEEI